MLDIVFESDTHIIIRGEAVFCHAVQLYDELKPVLGGNRSIIVDLSGMEAVDLSAFQVFIALSRENQTAGIRFVNCPQQIKRRLEIAGLDKWIRAEEGD